MCNKHNQTSSTGNGSYLPKGGFSNPTKPKIGSLALGGYTQNRTSVPTVTTGQAIILYGSQAAKDAYNEYMQSVLLPEDVTKAPWLKHLTDASKTAPSG